VSGRRGGGVGVRFDVASGERPDALETVSPKLSASVGTSVWTSDGTNTGHGAVRGYGHLDAHHVVRARRTWGFGSAGEGRSEAAAAAVQTRQVARSLREERVHDSGNI
jgi:hypothetical protein